MELLSFTIFHHTQISLFADRLAATVVPNVLLLDQIAFFDTAVSVSMELSGCKHRMLILHH